MARKPQTLNRKPLSSSAMREKQKPQTASPGSVQPHHRTTEALEVASRPVRESTCSRLFFVVVVVVVVVILRSSSSTSSRRRRSSSSSGSGSGGGGSGGSSSSSSSSSRRSRCRSIVLVLA